jgi:ABC-type transport system substrate-binding protein
MKGVRRLASLLACLLLAAPALVPSADAQKRGGTYRAVLSSDPPTLDPAQATDTTSSAVIRQVFDGLVELDEKMRPVPSIAEKWTISPDQRVYTFTLRRGVRFQNGREAKAADFKYSLERAARGKKPWVVEKLAGAPEAIKGQATGIRGIRVVNDATLELTLSGPSPPSHAHGADAAFVAPRGAERLGPESGRPVGTALPVRPGATTTRWCSRPHDHFRGPLPTGLHRIINDDNTCFQEYRAG